MRGGDCGERDEGRGLGKAECGKGMKGGGVCGKGTMGKG